MNESYNILKDETTVKNENGDIVKKYAGYAHEGYINSGHNPTVSQTNESAIVSVAYLNERLKELEERIEQLKEQFGNLTFLIYDKNNFVITQ